MNENGKIELDVIKSSSNASDFLINFHEFQSNYYKSKLKNEEQIKSLNDKLHLSKLSRNIYYSEDCISDKKIYTTSSSKSLLNSQKISEQEYSTNPMRGTSTLSPVKRRKMPSLKMIQKSKYKKSFDSPEANKNEEIVTGRERRDAFGNIITKKNKRKIKVSFVDEINKEQPLANIIDIENFKKFNLIIGMPKEEHIKKDSFSSECQCCNIF